jgi:hypothetical protein
MEGLLVIQEFLRSILTSRLVADWSAPDWRMSDTGPLPNRATNPFTRTGHEFAVGTIIEEDLVARGSQTRS